MVLEENTVDPINVQSDPTHQEGIEHIKSVLHDRNGEPAVPPTDSTAGVTEHQPGLIDTVKTYLGYGNTTGTSGATDATTDGTTETASSEPHPADVLAPKTTEADKVNEHTSKTTNAIDSATGARSDPSDADQESTEAPSKPAQHAEPKPADGKPVDSKSMEHRSAIPTAGGIQLGEKHWGESDVVPELPPKQDTTGQSTSEDQVNTAINTGSATAINTGSATAPSTGTQEKPKMMEKIKDKLPFHNKD